MLARGCATADLLHLDRGRPLVHRPHQPARGFALDLDPWEVLGAGMQLSNLLELGRAGGRRRTALGQNRTYPLHSAWAAAARRLRHAQRHPLGAGAALALHRRPGAQFLRVLYLLVQTDLAKL